METYAKGGVTKSKLVMGMPTYGRAFTLSNPSENGISAKATKGTAGKYTREGGFVSFYEICQYLKQGYTVVQDPEKRIGPYAYNGERNPLLAFNMGKEENIDRGTTHKNSA